MSVLIKHMAMPKGCIYANDKDQTEYCPLLNHDDVPFCQYIENEPEIAIGIDERPVYCPLSDVPEPCQDAVSREDAIDVLDEFQQSVENGTPCYAKARAEMCNLPSVKPKHKTGRWIPIKWHDCTDEDREKYGFSDDVVAVFDCEMPDDNQAILVTTSHGYVNQDVCYIDDGFSLDSGWDWIEDVIAWMPLPEPYRKDGEADG